MTLLKEIQQQLKSKSTEAGKLSTQKFVPNSQEVYGTRMPDINELAKQYKAGGFELVKALWVSGAYEEKVLAAKLLNKICKKDPDQAIQLVEKFSNDISDWAVCDSIGMQSLKPVASLKEKENLCFGQSVIFFKKTPGKDDYRWFWWKCIRRTKNYIRLLKHWLRNKKKTKSIM
jgi:3-methyladenine DNA glycosylase AlkD